MSIAIEMNSLGVNRCSICLNEMHSSEEMPSVDERITTLCGHLFHESCLTQRLGVNNVCPVCQTNNPLNREIIQLDRIAQVEGTPREGTMGSECERQWMKCVYIVSFCVIISGGIFIYIKNYY